MFQLSLTRPQLRLIGLAALMVVLLLYYVVVARPSLFWAYSILGRKKYGNMEGNYVRAWAKAYRAGTPTFELAGKHYDATSGFRV